MWRECYFLAAAFFVVSAGSLGPLVRFKYSRFLIVRLLLIFLTISSAFCSSLKMSNMVFLINLSVIAPLVCDYYIDVELASTNSLGVAESVANPVGVVGWTTEWLDYSQGLDYFELELFVVDSAAANFLPEVVNCELDTIDSASMFRKYLSKFNIYPKPQSYLGKRSHSFKLEANVSDSKTQLKISDNFTIDFPIQSVSVNFVYKLKIFWCF